MSDGEVEVEAPQGYPVLPKEVTNEIGSTKLFNKWSYEDVEIRDISLTYVSYLQLPRRRWNWEGATHITRGDWLSGSDNANEMVFQTEITSRSANPSTSPTPPAATQ